MCPRGSPGGAEAPFVPPHPFQMSPSFSSTFLPPSSYTHTYLKPLSVISSTVLFCHYSHNQAPLSVPFTFPPIPSHSPALSPLHDPLLCVLRNPLSGPPSGLLASKATEGSFLMWDSHEDLSWIRPLLSGKPTVHLRKGQIKWLTCSPTPTTPSCTAAAWELDALGTYITLPQWPVRSTILNFRSVNH